MSSKKMSLIEAVKHITAGRKPTQPVKKLVEQDEPEETEDVDGIEYKDLDGKAQEKAIESVIDRYHTPEFVVEQFEEDCEQIEFEPTSWGVERDRHVKGDFKYSADSTAEAIVGIYGGGNSSILKTAQAYINAVKDESVDAEATKKFLTAIEEELANYTENTKKDAEDLQLYLGIKATVVDDKYTDISFENDAKEVSDVVFNVTNAPDWIYEVADALKPAAKEYAKAEDAVEENKENAVDEFKHDLQEELASMLQANYDYQFSTEGAKDTIEDNQIKFNEDGTINENSQILDGNKKPITEAKKEPKKEDKEIAGGKTITIVAFDENGGLEKLLNAIKEIDPGTKITIEGEEEVSISWESVIKTIAVEDVEEEPKEEKKEKPKKPKAPKKAPKDKEEEPVEEEEPEEVIKESKKKN